MYEYQCQILRVIDGDTVEAKIDLGFKVSKIETVRLLGINAPAVYSPDQATRSMAYAATAKLTELCKNVTLIRTHKDNREKYGRMLGELFSENPCQSINQAMLQVPGVVTYTL